MYMTRIRVNTDDLRTRAKDFDSASDALRKAGDEILALAMSMPSYDGQLSGPARKAGFEIQSGCLELSKDFANDAESLRNSAQSFDDIDNQIVQSLANNQIELNGLYNNPLIDNIEPHGDHTLGYDIDWTNHTIKLWYKGHFVVYDLYNEGQYSAIIEEFKDRVTDYESGQDDVLNAIRAADLAGICLVILQEEITLGAGLAALVLWTSGQIKMHNAINDAEDPWNILSNSTNNPYIIDSG
jgi:hypothetical protein